MKPGNRATAQYRVGITRGRWRYFDTLAEAQALCSRVFDASKIVLCIESVTRVTDTQEQER
jgi:hypothetical protein